ncbi:MAG: sterol desaturase family protein, partial [Spirochaetia bacterium]|nr:sterol desaturase family protein [Spirochaetia bacterium]
MSDLNGMRIDLLTFAIPAFFILIAVEVLISRIKRRDTYSFSDSIADLSCGISQITVDAFIKVAMLAGYIFIYNNFRFFDAPDTSIWTWIISFFALDFLYYWFHRFSHEINVIWGSHAPHHQSEEFNLTVALRQGSFQPVFSAVFYWPMAFLGISPLVFLVQGQISLIYQFWIHTRLIGTMGF